MHTLLHPLSAEPHLWIEPAAVFLATLAIAYAIRRIFFGALRSWIRRTPSRAAQALHDALRGPTHIWNLILAVHFAIQSSALPADFTGKATEVLQVLSIPSLPLMFMRIAGELVRQLGDQIPGSTPATTLTQSLAQVVVVILGVLVVLRVIGIEITPLLTALGVGGLAVALALQDTLSNLFGGFYVTVAGQIRLGDYVRLNSGEEGYISDISWRRTTIRGLSNNLVIVPNATMAKATITNYNLPEKRMSVS